MTVLIGPSWLEQRRALAADALAPLADSLAADLDRLLPDADVFVPPEKAKLTRRGGRCPRDGTLLEFDPTSPRLHRCPQCGTTYDDDVHYRWWVMGYQLWLAERAVHAAVLWALRGDPRHRVLAESILHRLAERYPSYPNVDNVLGPTRVFFSTYLESIWLLQLCVALDVLEAKGGRTPLGATVRDRLVDPSAGIIALYDEGLSNRQVWNNAALAAAGRLLDRPSLIDTALQGPSGLTTHLERGLLRDGTWYEGENYHLFAHRGLWYLVTLAEHTGMPLSGEALARFREGFATPFLTALPDLTMASRRDSQYGVSLRQWRVAESCELGLARAPGDERLTATLAELYRDDVTPGDTARWRSTAEAERNVPGVRLTRADLGWKSLLFGLPHAPPPPAPREAASVLLEGQGIAVMRRRQESDMGDRESDAAHRVSGHDRLDASEVYVALDYGHSGGGHGHPDRLNLWFVVGNERILEDVGTGSYVDPSLHWYRSTLAHNAPLLNGHSQPRVSGTLCVYSHERDRSWVEAEVELAPETVVRRTVMVMGAYFVDRVIWSAPAPVQLDLPVHVDAQLAPSPSWRAGTLEGGAELEDGFGFIEHAEQGGPVSPAMVHAGVARAWVHVDAPHEWWRCMAPGPPGAGPRPFLLVRGRSASGAITTVWTWSEVVRHVDRHDTTWRVQLLDATHEHMPGEGWWRIEERGEGRARAVHLAGMRPRTPAALATSPRVARENDRSRTVRQSGPPIVVPRLAHRPGVPGELTRWATSSGDSAPWRTRLGPDHYRRTEASWREAGSPEALVAMAATGEELCVEVTVRVARPHFRAWREENPLDNEHPDVDSDGVQLYVRGDGSREDATHYSWIVVPDPAADGVRVTPRRRDGPPASLAAQWRRVERGYQILMIIPRATLPDRTTGWIDVIVNEMGELRERRRGQLVLSGAHGEWAYLRGDRHDPDRYLPIRIAND